MWQPFKGIKGLLLTLLLLAAGLVNAQQLVRDLEQDWLVYHPELDGFLPANQQELETEIISFRISTSELDPFYLVIGTKEKATLFYNDKLLASLNPGYSSFKIDSLKNSIGDNSPYLTIYGRQLLPYLETAVYTSPFPQKQLTTYDPPRFANAFSNFFFTSSSILLLFFVLLKVRLPDIADQYLLVQRSLRFKTIDELIYKIPLLKFPNAWFILFIATVFSYAATVFMYFHPNEIYFFGWNPAMLSFGDLLIFWTGVSLILFVAIILKYLITAAAASVFGLRVTNVHNASSLRLLLLLGMILAVLSFANFTLDFTISSVAYWAILIAGLIIIEIILFFKLTLVTTHTLLYIIVYLCATELLPLVFLVKLYIA